MKRVEDVSRASEQRLRIATRAAKLGKFEWDSREDHAIWENDRMYEIFGHSPEDGAPSRRQFEASYLHPDDVDGVERALREASQQDGAFHFVGRIHRRSDGEQRWIECTGELHDQRLVGVVIDITEQKLAAETLRAGDSIIRHLVENSPFGVYVVDADFRLVQVSAGAQKVFENVRPLLGRDFAEVLRTVWVEPFASAAIERFQHTLATGEAHHSPRTIERRLDLGAVESYDWQIERVQLPDGRLGVVCHFYDLSERLRYEQALRDREAELRRSEGRFRELADAMPQLVWMADGDGKTTYYNSQVTRYDGITQKSDGHWIWRPVVHPEDLAATVAAWQHAVDTRSTYECQHRVRMADGSFRWHLSRAQCVAARQWFGTATDIHDLKEAQERLRESEQRFKTMADTAPATLWITDSAHQCTFLSRGWYELTGRPAEQGLGLGWTTAVHPDDRAQAVQTFLVAAARHETFANDYRLRSATGEYRWVIDAGRPRFDDEGEFLGYIGSVIDVHERKHVEQELQRLNAELSEANRRKDEFLAMLGHELRNPLAAIRTATQLMKLVAPDDARLARTQGVLERQSAHMTRLIDGLLEVSRIARGKIRLDPETLDLREIIAILVEDRMSQIEARGLVLDQDFSCEPLWVYADPVRLAQIFDNLLGNAMKFTSKPGHISLSLHASDGEAVIRVRDTGVGIEPEMLERVFEPFQQESQEIHRGAGGLGLGLALAKNLIELHGGSIRARSAGRGTGTEFEVRLPLTSAAPVARATEALAKFERRRVLIVEDSVDAGQTLHALLEMLGHQATLVETGAAALEFLQTHGADVVLCDLGLPGMSGYEVAHAVREHASLQRTRLVALTGYGQPEDRKRSAEAGFDDHLTKPVDRAELDTVLGQ